jgi:hypothetical protein
MNVPEGVLEVAPVERLVEQPEDLGPVSQAAAFSPELSSSDDAESAAGLGASSEEDAASEDESSDTSWPSPFC